MTMSHATPALDRWADASLRAPIAQAYGGFDPFERVADFLTRP
jgi:hypothetical protein